VPAFRVKLGANDLNCVDVPLNPTHSLTQLLCITNCFSKLQCAFCCCTQFVYHDVMIIVQFYWLYGCVVV